MELNFDDQETGALPVDARARLDAVRRDCFTQGELRTDLHWVAGVTQRAVRAESSLLTVLDADRQHFLSQRGFEKQLTGTPLSQSLCRIVVERAAPLVVHDAAQHRLLAGHPAVTELGVASYAGVPVRSPDGLVLGALCVLGRTPRIWSADDLGDLETIAAVVRDEIDLSARRRADAEAGGPLSGFDSRPSSPAAEGGAFARRVAAALAAGEFELHYQPIVELGSQRIYAYEALLRWNDPDHGMLPPPMFLAAAERAGAMPALTRFVVRTACKQLASWAAGGYMANVSINASPAEILSAEFVPLVRAELAFAGVADGSLIIEMTEQIADTEPETLAQTMAALARTGTRLALDDFGTEHSSLNRLRELPIEILKVDRRFLDGIPTDPKACAILDVMLGLGDVVDARVVCEGIETEEQYRYVRDRGCRYGQGWLFGRPTPAGSGPPPGWPAAVRG